MPFITQNIDRAIVMTQHDLRGFRHPLGFRMEPKNPKNLDAITCNLAAMAAGLGGEKKTTPADEHYADYFGSSFEDYLAMCKRLANECDGSEKEAIRLIIQEIIKQSEEMKVEVAAGKRKPSGYLQPLERNNRWGKAVLALAEAFGVSLEKAAA